jgi:glycosyltransferase involved in cell wall biosynthesis
MGARAKEGAVSESQPTLSVNLIVFNEVDFIDAYMENTVPYVDELVIIDGGSTDGTIERIEAAGSEKIKLTVWPQKGDVYGEGWQEPQRRNLAIDNSTGDWLLKKDADEFFLEQDYDHMRELMRAEISDVYAFPAYHFWGSPDRIRVDSPGDEHWTTDYHFLLWRANLGLRYREDMPLHTVHAKDGVTYTQCSIDNSVRRYHYHWALGKIKVNDLRRVDAVGDISVIPPANENLAVDSNLLDWKRPNVVTVPFEGEQPAAVALLREARSDG